MSPKGSHLVPDDGSKESLLPQDYQQPEHRGYTRTRNHILLTTINFAGLCMSVAFFALALNLRLSNMAAIRKTSLYTPVFDATEIRTSFQHIDGSLFESDLPWYGPPGDAESEAAWDQFEHIRTIPLTRRQVIEMGKDPSQVAKFEDEYWHMGEEVYVGALDLPHQTHCLNLLRKAAFAHYGEDARETGNKISKIEYIHLQHCSSLLMQHMLCTADAGMLTYTWVEENPHPFPDFGVNKQCRDWRQLVEYRDTHAVDLEMYKGYHKPDWIQEKLVREGNHSMYPPGIDPKTLD